jgi:hypothetical protein
MTRAKDRVTLILALYRRLSVQNVTRRQPTTLTCFLFQLKSGRTSASRLPQAWQTNRDSISDRRKPDLYGALNSEAAARREEQTPVSFAERFRPIQQRDIYQSGFAVGGAPDGDYYDPFSGIKILSADDNAAAQRGHLAESFTMNSLSAEAETIWTGWSACMRCSSWSA